MHTPKNTRINAGISVVWLRKDRDMSPAKYYKLLGADHTERAVAFVCVWP